MRAWDIVPVLSLFESMIGMELNQNVEIDEQEWKG